MGPNFKLKNIIKKKLIMTYFLRNTKTLILPFIQRSFFLQSLDSFIVSKYDFFYFLLQSQIL